MVCTKCGRETSENFCNYCGEPLDVENASLLNEEELSESSSRWRDKEPVTYQNSSAVNKEPLRRKGKEKEKVKTVVKKETIVKEIESKEKKHREDRREGVVSRRQGGDRPQGDSSDGAGLANMAVKGAAGVLVLSSRLMQFFSSFLMAYMVWIMSRAFLKNLNGLGPMQSIFDDNNYSLALYLILASASLGMGVIWCLWILTKKAGGGQIRLKTYDVGRGFYPFLICAVLVFLAGPALSFVASEAAFLGEVASGIEAVLKAVNLHKGTLLFCSVLGAGFSLVRKILRV